MVQVIPVNLPYNVKTLWFDPNGLDIHADDDVVVTTARGLEIGRAAGDVFEVSYERVKSLKSPLRKVERLATPEDLERAREMERLSAEAMPVFKELARETSEDMHPVSVEYLLDGDKAIFYFEAEERIDFRDLVRKLASRFQVRVDMRQIGVRDEARIVGGIGHCGQIVCCKRMGGEFKPVSIRMAKAQDLSLNPQKISGLCGRLMCCLRYENEAYKDFKSRAPKAGATVQTPDGPAKVDSLDVPREYVKVRIEGEKPVSVPLSAFEEAEEGKRPDTITQEGWEEATAPAPVSFEADLDIFSTSKFTGSDKLGGGTAVHHEGTAADPLAPKKPRRRRRSQKVGGGSAEGGEGQAPKKKRTSRRRSTKVQAGGGQGGNQGGGQEQSRKKPASQAAKQAKRPGQKSSGLSGGKQQEKKRAPKDGAAQAEGSSGQGQNKRRRRRRHKSGGGQGGGKGDGGGAQGGAGSPSSSPSAQGGAR